MAHTTSTGTGSSTGMLGDEFQRTVEGAREQVATMAEDASEMAMTMTEDMATAIRNHPYASVAVAAGLAFAIGALWKLNQPKSRFKSWMRSMPDMESVKSGDFSRLWR